MFCKSQHITTILRRLSVIPLSGADNVATSVPGAMDPPFVITGTSKQPFLAKIELQFNEISAAKNPDTSDPSPECQTVFLEHWVEVRRFQFGCNHLMILMSFDCTAGSLSIPKPSPW